MNKMTLLINPEEFNENILRTETSLTQKSYNNWLHKAVEEMREIFDDYYDYDIPANTLFGDVIKMLSNIEIKFATNELNEDNMFDLCANKSMSEIEQMLNKARSTNDYQFNWDVLRQAIRYYMSRLLEGYLEENPLEGINLLVETDGDSNHKKQFIIKIYQDKIDGKIWYMMNGNYYWNDFDDFSTEMQYDLLKQLVNCI